MEIAVVTLDCYGSPIRAFHSLVDPGRPIPADASRVHGLRDADVQDAPRLAELAGQLWPMLAGRVVVCHNVKFDCAFLTEELPHPHRRAAWLQDSVCTLRLFQRYWNRRANTKLAQCCSAVGVPLPTEVAHTALGDTLACAGLFRRLLDLQPWPPTWDAQLRQAAARPWPPTPAVTRPAAPREMRGIAEVGGYLTPDCLLRITELGPPSAPPSSRPPAGGPSQGSRR